MKLGYFSIGRSVIRPILAIFGQNVWIIDEWWYFTKFSNPQENAPFSCAYTSVRNVRVGHHDVSNVGERGGGCRKKCWPTTTLKNRYCVFFFVLISPYDVLSLSISYCVRTEHSSLGRLIFHDVFCQPSGRETYTETVASDETGVNVTASRNYTTIPNSTLGECLFGWPVTGITVNIIWKISLALKIVWTQAWTGTNLSWETKKNGPSSS